MDTISKHNTKTVTPRAAVLMISGLAMIALTLMYWLRGNHSTGLF